MGRTIPSWRVVLEEELKRWEKFKEALRIDERIVFEDLMDECFPVKSEGMFLSILFAHHMALKQLCDKVERINSRFAFGPTANQISNKQTIDKNSTKSDTTNLQEHLGKGVFIPVFFW